MYIINAINVFLLLILINKVVSKCEKTFIHECEKVSDVERYGQRTWENLLISPNRCKKNYSRTLDEILKTNALSKVLNIEELQIIEKITAIELGAFNGLKKLCYLQLYKNQIKVLPTEVFANLRVYKIDLKNNGIENVQSDVFKGSTITIINLSHNKLNNIKVNVLNLESLEKLIITNNQIQSLEAGCFHENLEYLNLASNTISYVPEDVLKPLTNLKELDFSYNRFKSISLSYALPSLENLDLSHNEISNIEAGSFQNFLELKRLKLNHNYLTSISHNIFSTGNLIVSLHLHYNAFMNIQEKTAKILQNLQELTISGNPWACPCLQIIANYTQENKISQPDCDQKYFSVGESAICLVTNESCTFEEQLTQEAFDQFQNSLSKDFCIDL